MGGKALKNVVCRRYGREEYFALKERILARLRPYSNQIDVPREFPGKESFGDLDILFVYPSVELTKLIEELFHPTELVHNNQVFSFDFEQFQIDIILISNELFQHALVYFSYSDLGGLIGNVCHKIGLKYGIQGLWMNVHTKEFDPTTTSTQLILSSDAKQIFDFLGYDYNRYVQGFDNDRQLFAWLTCGKYFRRYYFDADQLNHAHRQRTSKRPVYIRFVAFLNEQPPSQVELDESRDNDVNQQRILEIRQAALIFFDKQHEYDRGFHRREEKQQLKKKYSGHLFFDIDCPKAMINVHMKNFEQKFGKTNEEFRQWVLETDQETIINEVNKYKQELKMQLADENPCS